MRIFLPLLCALCATSARGGFDGTCLRKDPPPGVLVVSTGSKLELTCGGHVKVNGVNVRNSSHDSKRAGSSKAAPTHVNIINNTGVSRGSDKHAAENILSKGYHSNPTTLGVLRHMGTGYTTSPNAHKDGPTGVHRLDPDSEAEEEEEGGEEGSRVTRGINSRHLWRWNRRTVGKGDRDWGEITFERRGAALSLSSVRPTDSGRYTCCYKGREMFSLQVRVADPPESPSLTCYKRSPSSKIRCEWVPKKPVTIAPTCSLLISKSPTKPFHHFNCSYSPLASRCWCAVDHDEEEVRASFTAYLCATSIAGNATSALQHFTPMDIIKPDPPSRVSARQVEGQETRLVVTWSLPTSWKSQNNFYKLIYEMKYKPLFGGNDQEQVEEIKKGAHSSTITDALPGVKYQIQIRAKDEYDGHWSAWSEHVFASTWTAPQQTTTSPDYIFVEGSGTDDSVTEDPGPVITTTPVTYHILWITGSFLLLSVILIAYMLRHKDRLMSKLHGVNAIVRGGGSAQPPTSTSTPPVAHALVTFGPLRYKEPPPSEEQGGEEENEEDVWVKERMEAVHFDNTSYFFL